MLSSNLLLINPQCNAVMQWVGLVRIEESCPSFPPPPSPFAFFLPLFVPFKCRWSKKERENRGKDERTLINPLQPKEALLIHHNFYHKFCIILVLRICCIPQLLVLNPLLSSPGPSCSKGGKCYPTDKSLTSG